jgi:8-oxo-dGTP pyrophosphatase MutT (NUDIX family)
MPCEGTGLWPYLMPLVNVFHASAVIRKTGPVSTVYTSPWWTVEEHAVTGLDGQPGMFNVLHCGDGVTVLATTGDDFWLIREYKYAIGRDSWQLPSGSIDNG